MKSRAQLEESIDRFRRKLWNRETLGRPPVGVAAARAWLPIGYLRREHPDELVRPDEIGEALARTDYADWFAARPVQSDDFLPFVAAWRAVPWLEAICGCPVRCSTGSLAPVRCVGAVEDLKGTPIPGNTEWMDALRRETLRLRDGLPDDCWLSTTILRGNSDALAAMRGLDEFLLDLYDNPLVVAKAAGRVNQLHREILDLHFSLAQPKMGGYGHIYGYWAPGPTTVLQEDVLGLCSPKVYRELFMQLTADLIALMGEHVFFHLHSTGYRHYRHVLDIPGIAGLEITVEGNGPSLADLVPVLREILERSRLILMIDGHVEQLAGALRGLPSEGLYLLVSDNYIKTESEFRSLAETAWK